MLTLSTPQTPISAHNMPKVILAIATLDNATHRSLPERNGLLDWCEARLYDASGGVIQWAYDAAATLVSQPHPILMQRLWTRFQAWFEGTDNLQQGQTLFQSHLAKAAFKRLTRIAAHQLSDPSVRQQILDIHTMIEDTDSVGALLSESLTIQNGDNQSTTAFDLNALSLDWLTQTLLSDKATHHLKNVNFVCVRNLLKTFQNDEWNSKNKLLERSRLILALMEAYSQRTMEEHGEPHTVNAGLDLVLRQTTLLAGQILSGLTSHHLLAWVTNVEERTHQITGRSCDEISPFTTHHGLLHVLKRTTPLTRDEKGLILAGLILNDKTKTCVRLQAKTDFNIKAMKAFLAAIGRPKAFTLTQG